MPRAVLFAMPVLLCTFELCFAQQFIYNPYVEVDVRPPHASDQPHDRTSPRQGDQTGAVAAEPVHSPCIGCGQERRLTLGEHLELLHRRLHGLTEMIGLDSTAEANDGGSVSLRTLFEDLATQLAALQKDTEEVQNSNVAAAAQRKEMQQAISATQTQFAKQASKQTSALAAAIAKTQESVSGLAPQVLRIDKQLDGVASKKSLQAVAGQIKELDERIEQQAKSHDAQAKRLGRAGTGIADANRRLGELQAAVASLQKRPDGVDVLKQILTRLDKLEACCQKPQADKAADASDKPCSDAAEVPAEVSEAGLRWIVDHQFREGYWSFRHGRAPHARGSALQGQYPARHAATGLALLTLMEYDHTPATGSYQKQVRAGAEFLQRDASRGKGKLEDDDNARNYGQAIGTLALLRVYQLSPSDKLKRVLQQCVNRIVQNQNRKSGGWGYRQREAGSTPITAWQVEALATARGMDFEVPSHVLLDAERFLASMRTRSGNYYGYDHPENHLPTTAPAIDARLSIGWNAGHPGLHLPVGNIVKSGPLDDNYYFNFYASRVLQRLGHDGWSKWRDRLSETLIKQQISEGRDRGAWNGNRDEGVKAAGMLYNTTFALLTLKQLGRCVKSCE